MKEFNEYWNERGESDLRALRLANRRSDILHSADDAVNIRQAAQNAWDAALEYHNGEVNEHLISKEE